MRTNPLTIQYHRNTLRQDLEAVRPKNLKRVIALDQLVAYEVERHGPVYREWLSQRQEDVDPSLENFVQDLKPADYRALVESGAPDILHRDDVEFLFDVSNRAVRDTIRTVQHFRFPL